MFRSFIALTVLTIASVGLAQDLPMVAYYRDTTGCRELCAGGGQH